MWINERNLYNAAENGKQYDPFGKVWHYLIKAEHSHTCVNGTLESKIHTQERFSYIITKDMNKNVHRNSNQNNTHAHR